MTYDNTDEDRLDTFPVYKTDPTETDETKANDSETTESDVHSSGLQITQCYSPEKSHLGEEECTRGSRKELMRNLIDSMFSRATLANSQRPC